MAEENTEELSMEDILSSIKDILTDDEQAKSPAAEPAAETVAAAQPQQNAAAPEPVDEPAEDILELSPSMRIEEDLANASEGINLDAELGNISPNLDDISLESAPAVAPVSESEEEFNPEDILKDLPVLGEDKDLESDPFDFSPAPEENEVADEETPVTEPADNSWAWDKEEDDESEPFIAVTEQAETEVEAETVSDAFDEPVISQNSVPETAEIVEDEPEVSFTPATEENMTPEIPAEPETYADPEPVENLMPEIAEPSPEQAAPQKEDINEDVTSAGGGAVDVSASIINNFAKMFSSEESPAAKASAAIELPEEPVRQLGNASTTIEDVVAKVIRSIIGEEVAANWRKFADYDALAREEIKARTESWLNENLPALVEKIVKQEIERVMAKVGSQD